MVDLPQHIKYDLFPTHIVRSKCPTITPEDKKEMMACTGRWFLSQSGFDRVYWLRWMGV
jgi:hypothetical protein